MFYKLFKIYFGFLFGLFEDGEGGEVATETTETADSGEVNQQDLVDAYNEEGEYVNQEDIQEEEIQTKPENEEKKEGSEKLTEKSEKETKEQKRLDIEDMFFAKDDKGQETFNKQAYNQFFDKAKDVGKIPPLKNRVAETTAQTQTQGQEQAPEKPRTVAETIIERKKAEQEKLFTYRSHLNEALTRLGFTSAELDQADRYAMQATQDSLSNMLDTERDELYTKRENERLDNERKNIENTKLESMARSNQSIIANELGGWDKLNTILTHPDLGGADINRMFDLMNPDAKFEKQEDLQTALSSFVNKLSSNMDNLRYITNIALMRLDKRLSKYRDAGLRQIGAENANQSRNASLNAGSVSSAISKQSTESLSPIEKWLQNKETKRSRETV